MASRYVNPVPGGSVQESLDQGIDWRGTPGQAVVSIGRAKVIRVSRNAGGFGIAVYLRLLDGPWKGRVFYVGHGDPLVQQGQTVQAGDPIVRMLQHPHGNSPGDPGHVEIGWAGPGGGGPAYPLGSRLGGQRFLTDLRQLGIAAPGKSSAVGQVSNDPASVILSYAPKYGLDPIMVMAYALEEGGLKWGAVGDHGTSFGPFQAHIGGEAGSRSPQQAAQWANSPQGLIEMMQRMARSPIVKASGTAQLRAIYTYFGKGSNNARAYQRALALLPQAEQMAAGYNPNHVLNGDTAGQAGNGQPPPGDEARAASAQVPAALPNTDVPYEPDAVVNDTAMLWSQITSQDNLAPETSQLAAQYLSDSLSPSGAQYGGVGTSTPGPLVAA